MDEEAFREKYGEINLEGTDTSDEDYVYRDRRQQESFRLIDFITAISIILYEVEEIYKRAEVE